MDDIRTEEVTFTSDGLELRGTLRVPAPADGSAVALTGPFTGVREQVTGHYADRLARAGLVTLAFDHRGSVPAAGGAVTRTPRASSPTCGRRCACWGRGRGPDRPGGDLSGRRVRGQRRRHRSPGTRRRGHRRAYNSPAWFARDPAGYRAALRGLIDSYDDYLPAVAPDHGAAAMARDYCSPELTARMDDDTPAPRRSSGWTPGSTSTCKTGSRTSARRWRRRRTFCAETCAMPPGRHGQPQDEKPDHRTGGVGDQVVDVDGTAAAQRDPEQELGRLDAQAGRARQQGEPADVVQGRPEQREQHAQRDEHDHVEHEAGRVHVAGDPAQHGPPRLAGPVGRRPHPDREDRDGDDRRGVQEEGRLCQPSHIRTLIRHPSSPRSALIAAALRLVDERGLERVTVEQISAAVDVSPHVLQLLRRKDDALIGDPLIEPAEMRARLAAVPAGTPVIAALLPALAPVIAQIQAERGPPYERGILMSPEKETAPP